MTHPGLVMFMVGVGLGAILYYFFASATEHMAQTRQPRNRQELNRTHWSTSASSDSRNRRQNQEECMICLDDTNKENAVRLVPCRHVFHKFCIEEWRINGAGDARTCCPICRDKILDLVQL